MLPEATWTVAGPDTSVVEMLAGELGLNPIVARCIVNRGHDDPSLVREYLEPRLSSLTSPDSMADLSRAAKRTVEAIARGERIGVFGDYDVDGVTSAALVTSFLRDLDVDGETAIADRFAGGYGLTPAVVEEMHAKGVALLIVVDCGTSDHAAANRARELGVDIIIVDHHAVEGNHPEVAAFVNPQRKDCGFPDKGLAAVGLAFYFVAAVRSRLVEGGRLERSKVDPRNYLDLVALGTVADVAPLVGNNRIFVSFGLKQLSESRRPGLTALVKTSRIRSRRMRSEHISYQLAPRLNAAGRLASARDSFEILIARGQRESAALADRLEALTMERRQIEERVSNEARRQVDELGIRNSPVIVVGGDGWHRGVLGIVAARLGEEFRRPTYVIGFEGDEGVGSARSQGQINLHKSLMAVERHLVRFGGHRDAAGFTIERSSLTAFRKDLSSHVASLDRRMAPAPLVCDGRLNPSQLTSSLLSDLERLGPFGNGNPEPVFEVAGLDVLGARVVGGSHLKLELKTPTGTVSAFGPRMGAIATEIPPMIRVAASVTHDEWRGEGTPELRLVQPPSSDG